MELDQVRQSCAQWTSFSQESMGVVFVSHVEFTIELSFNLLQESVNSPSPRIQGLVSMGTSLGHRISPWFVKSMKVIVEEPLAGQNRHL